MKTLVLSLCFFSCGICSAQTWENVGVTNIVTPFAHSNLAHDGETLYLSSNNPYDVGLKSVYTYDGMNWSLLGDSCFANSQTFNSETMTAMNGAPYVISQNATGRVIVHTYNGTNWVLLGDPLTVDWGKSMSITHENGILYAGFFDFNENGVVVKKWTGTNWETLGGGSITTGITNYVSLHVENGIAYLACQEDNALHVFSYENGVWNELGLQPVSSGYASNIHLAVEDSVIMVSYENDDNLGELVVISYENGLWNQVGASSMPYVTGLHTNLSLLYHAPLLQFRQIDGVQSVAYFHNGVWEYVGGQNLTSGAVTGCDLLIEGTDIYITYRDVELNDTVYVKKYVDPLSLFEEKHIALTLYPNPCASEFHVLTDEHINEVRVIDMAGHVLVTSTKPSLDVSKIPSGIYTVEIITGQGTYHEGMVKE